MFITPEFCLTGYPPGDLLFREDFIEKVNLYKNRIIKLTTKKKTIFALSIPLQKEKLFNGLLLIRSGKVLKTFIKKKLPNYGVFDEKRYFSFDKKIMDNDFKLRNKKIKFLICEDMWGNEHLKKQDKVDLIISLNASPFEIGKDKTRKKIAKENVSFFNSKLIYLNSVGSQDDLVFDGGSFLMNKNGQVISQEKIFEESEKIIDTEYPENSSVEINENNFLLEALGMSLKNYVTKNNFKSLIIGLSGGIDSALCLAIAAKNFEAKNIFPYYLPTKYSSDESEKDAFELCKNFGIKLRKLVLKTTENQF